MVRVVLVLLLLAIPFVGCARREISPPAAEKVKETTWTEHVDQAGQFRILLPGAPEFQSQAETDPNGALAFQGLMVHTEKNSKVFMVGYYDVPAPLQAEGDVNPEAILERCVMGIAKRQGQSLEKESSIELGDHPGKEYLFTQAEHGDKSLFRVYYVDHRIYQLVANWAPSLNQSSIDAQKFLDSFELTP